MGQMRGTVVCGQCSDGEVRLSGGSTKMDSNDKISSCIGVNETRIMANKSHSLSTDWPLTFEQCRV